MAITAKREEAEMPEANHWNDLNEEFIAEFRANGGRVGGAFEGVPVGSCTIAATRPDENTSIR